VGAAARRSGSKGDKRMIVEMRVYHCAPGRLPALNERFTTITLGFFKKYGIEPIGFWTTLAGPSNQALTYLLKWESLAEREQKWNAFQADPDWIRQRNATEAEKIIVERVDNSFLAPTAYSPLR
jgi:hypothetical protein